MKTGRKCLMPSAKGPAPLNYEIRVVLSWQEILVEMSITTILVKREPFPL